MNTLPVFIANLAEALAPGYPRELATEGSSLATEHGGERARVTRYSPSELIQEYQLLRDVIFIELERDGPLTEHERATIIKSIDKAMGESLMAYFLVHEGLKEQFATALTHDLRNPLSAIKAATDLMLRYPDRVDQVPVLAGRILENVKRIDRMTHDLLDASRVRFGEKIGFEVAELELLALIREATAQLATVHGDRFVLKGTPIRGYWNADAFKRAVENLIINAIKYGDPRAPIEIVLEEHLGRAIVSVHNEGPHIPTEEQESLFRSFMRTRMAQGSDRKGWGIGLAMVRGMAEGHGGSITVDSAPGRGTTFIIDVPVDSRPHLNNPTTNMR